MLVLVAQENCQRIRYVAKEGDTEVSINVPWHFVVPCIFSMVGRSVMQTWTIGAGKANDFTTSPESTWWIPFTPKSSNLSQNDDHNTMFSIFLVKVVINVVPNHGNTIHQCVGFNIFWLANISSVWGWHSGQERLDFKPCHLSSVNAHSDHTTTLCDSGPGLSYLGFHGNLSPKTTPRKEVADFGVLGKHAEKRQCQFPSRYNSLERWLRLDVSFTLRFLQICPRFLSHSFL